MSWKIIVKKFSFSLSIERLELGGGVESPAKISPINWFFVCGNERVGESWIKFGGARKHLKQKLKNIYKYIVEHGENKTKTNMKHWKWEKKKKKFEGRKEKNLSNWKM